MIHSLRRAVCTVALGLLLAVVCCSAPASAAPAAVRRAVDLAVHSEDPGEINRGNPRTGIDIEVQLTNYGSEDISSQLTFTLPTGWTAGPARGYTKHLSCRQTGRLVTCTEDETLRTGDNRLTDLRIVPPAAAAGGTRAAIAVHGEPVGKVDEKPSNNDASFAVLDAGTADLHTSITASSTEVGRGRSIDFTLTITNRGPDATDGLGAGLLVETATHDGFLQYDAHGPGTVEIGSADPPDAQNPYSWEPGRLGPGHSAQLTFKWRGEKLGATGHLQVEVGEDNDDPGAEVTQGRYEVVRLSSRTITVVRKTSSSSPPTSPASSGGAPSSAVDPGSGTGSHRGSAGDPLADTGTSSLPSLDVALAALVLGALLTLAGTRHSRHRH